MDAVGIGLLLIVLGITGLIVKAEVYQVKRNSHTGHPLRWAPYGFFIVGIILILQGIFSY